jgi:hypothetical protein
MIELISSSSRKGKYHLRLPGEAIPLDEQLQPAQNELMTMLRFLICVIVIGAAVAKMPAETGPADVGRYGPFPTNYKEIVSKWLQTQLIDPASARIEWKTEPKPSDLGTKGEHLYGYLVDFTVNARNRFGAYTGKQEHRALIRNGEVVKGIGFAY